MNLYYAGAKATIGSDFGLSDETTIPSPMCIGDEYQLTNCPTFSLNNINCSDGNQQAGVYCIEGW